MPTKFKRESFRETAHGTHRDPDDLRVRKPLSTRNRLRLIFLGLAVAAVALLLMEVVSPFPRFRGQPLREGTATVTEKLTRELPHGEEAHLLVLTVTTPDGQARETSVDTDRASWENTEEGQQVRVEYQESQSGDAVRVLRIFAPEADTEE